MQNQSQVYGQLHNFLRNLPGIASNLSKDVYHVHKKLKLLHDILHDIQYNRAKINLKT